MKYSLSQAILFLFISVVAIRPALSLQNFHASRITSDDGLPNNFITAMLEDEQGFMWFGTFNGLSRYEGKSITNFSYQADDPNSLSDNLVYKLYLDSHKDIWVGTYSNGLNRYHAETQTFSRYLPGESIYGFYEDSQGQYWVGTNDSLLKIDRDGHVLESHLLNAQINRIQEIGDALYFTKMNQGLFRLSAGVVEAVNDLKVYYYKKDRHRDGFYWVCAKDGLYEFDSKRNEWTQLLSGYTIMRAAYYDDETLWLSTVLQGVLWFDIKTKSIKRHFHKESKDSYIPNNETVKMHKDRSGIVWLGTQEGVIKLKPSYFKSYLYGGDQKDALPYHFVNAVQEDAQGHIWVGTLGGGITKLVPGQDKFIRFDDQYNQNLLVTAMQLNDHFLWVGTAQGLLRFDIRSYQWKNFNQIIDYNGIITSLDVTQDQELLIGTMHDGFKVFDLTSEKLRHYQYSNQVDSLILSNTVFSVVESSDQKYLVGSSNGFSIVDPKLNRAKHFRHESTQGIKLSHNAVRSVYQDQKGHIWLNTGGGGLDRIVYSDKDGYQINYYLEKHGLVNNVVTGMYEDSLGFLWVTTHKGISRFDQQTGMFMSFGKSDGLPFDSMSETTILQASTGRMYMGGMGGIITFDPSEIKPSTFEPATYVTKLSIDYQAIPKLVSVIPLTHHNKAIAIQFAALDFSAPEKNQYAFMLEGFDDDWNYVGGKNEAVYTNIPSGDYRFLVKATNSDGVWSGHVSALSINVKPPFWQTLWAYIIYSIVFVAVMSWLIKSRTLKFQRQAAMLEQQVRKRTRKIEDQKLVIEGLLEKKDQLFANVSHELRTPLTLIMGPLNQLIKSIPDQKHKKSLNMIKRNSYRLLKMVEELLTLSRLKSLGEESKIPQSVSLAIQLLLDSLSSFAADKGVSLQVINDDDVWVDMVSDALEAILLNVVINAIKYTPRHGEVLLRVETVSENVIITIEDTGKGIKGELLDEVFEPYKTYTADASGIGLGLPMVKGLVEAHGGEIKLESQPGIGTSVKVRLPLGEKPELKESREPNISYDLLATIEYEFGPDEPEVRQSKGAQIFDLGEQSTILVIDDAGDMRYYLEGMLRPRGYQVYTAGNGENGIAYAKDIIPDLILCDIMMPGIDGYEVVDQLRNDEKTSHIPIILLTAKGDKESRLHGYMGKIDDYITKPFDEDELLARIKSVISIRELLKKQFSNKTIDEVAYSVDAISGLNPKDRDFIDRLQKIVKANYQDNKYSIEQLSSAMNLSERPLQRKLKAILGLTPNAYLRTYRLEKAAELLRTNDFPIDKLAYQTGFSNRSYFSSCFKAYFGVTPKEYQKSGCAKNAESL